MELLIEFIKDTEGVEILPNEMYEWRPFGDDNRFTRFKKYSNIQIIPIYGTSPIFEILEEIVLGKFIHSYSSTIVLEQWDFPKYESWNEAVTKFISTYNNQYTKNTIEKNSTRTGTKGNMRVIPPDSKFDVSKKVGGRPKNPELEKRNKKIQKEYYQLSNKKHLKKSEVLKRFSEKYNLAPSTIDQYTK